MRGRPCRPFVESLIQERRYRQPNGINVSPARDFGDQTGAFDLSLSLGAAKECQRRLHFPVTGSRASSTMAQWPADRSRICPLIDVAPFLGVLLELLGVLLEYVPRPSQGLAESAGIDTVRPT